MFGGLYAPMLARLERTLPRGDLWRYEPKLDGFRGLLWRAPSGSVYLLSRNLKDLSSAFPELVRAGRDLSLDTLLDGEIVIADADGRSNFGALQERLGKSRRDSGREALRSPAGLVAFDVARDAGVDLVDRPLRDRRCRLEALFDKPRACLQLVAQTASVVEAEEWLALCAWSRGRRRQALRRSISAWPTRVGESETAAHGRLRRHRHRRRPCATRPVLGLRHPDGAWHHFGIARPAKHMVSPQLYQVLAQAGPEQHPLQSRWQHAAVPAWCPVPPTAVCEVAFTLLDSGRWLRPPALRSVAARPFARRLLARPARRALSQANSTPRVQRPRRAALCHAQLAHQ